MNLQRPLNKYIDHTLLQPTATYEDFESFLDDAIEHDFASICMSPYMAVKAVKVLEEAGHPDIRVGTVVGFPHGNTPLALKVYEADFYMERGIKEIDFVLNYGELKGQNIPVVIQEIRTMGDICKRRGVVSKCIVEACVLTEQEKTMIFSYIRDFAPNVDFIKTSTGFANRGADLDDVVLWNKLRGSSPRPLIKAAGGIRTFKEAQLFINAGADRIGTSAGVSILEEEKNVEVRTEDFETFTEGEEEA